MPSSSFKIIYKNSDWEDVRFKRWIFYFEDAKANENGLLIKNKFKYIEFDGWKCYKLYSKVNFEGNQSYKLHDSNINDFFINFFKDVAFENSIKIKFDNSFNYSDIIIDNSDLIKLLNKSDIEISDIFNRHKRYSEFNDDILYKITKIDHIEIQTYLNSYAIETSKLGESKFNWFLTSTFDSSFELSVLPSFHRKNFNIWSAAEFKVNDEYFIYIGEIGYNKYLMMNSKDETAELFDENSFFKLNLDFVAHFLDFTFILNNYYKDWILFRLSSLK